MGSIELGPGMAVMCLFKRMECTVYEQRLTRLRKRLVDVVFTNAKMLIDILGIQERILQRAYNTCNDEWLDGSLESVEKGYTL